MKSFGSIMLKVYAYGFAASALLMVLTSFPHHNIIGWTLYSLFVASMALAVLAGFGLMLRKPIGPQLAWRIAMPSYVFIFFVYVLGFMPEEAGSYVNDAWYVALTLVATLFIMASFALANIYAFQPFDILTGKRKFSMHRNTTNRPINQNIVLQPARDPLLIPFFKLILMSLITLGIYDIYWFYRQWQHALNGTETKGGILLRAAFSGLTSFWLFKRLALNDWVIISSLYLIIPYFAYLPDPYEFLWVLSVLPLIYAQQQLNERFQYSNRGLGSYSTLEKWLVGIMVPIWTILIALIIIGSYIPVE